MKKYDYYKPISSRNRKPQKVRKKNKISLIKPLFLFVIFIALCFGGYWAVKRAYAAISAARMGQWKPSAVVVSGVEGAVAAELLSVAEPKKDKPFSLLPYQYSHKP